MRAAKVDFRRSTRLSCRNCPAARGLVRDRDPALCEQILDVTKADCEPQIEPNRLMYDLRQAVTLTKPVWLFQPAIDLHKNLTQMPAHEGRNDG
jgi:hypothetical protein